VGTGGTGRSTARGWAFDGTRWVRSRLVEGVPSALIGVDSIGPDDAWAVGGASDASALAEHWDGRSWTRVDTPAAPAYSNDQLQSVTMVSSHDVWAAGYNTDEDLKTTALIEHWNGHRWRRADIQLPPGTANSRLYAISAAAKDDIWAVGIATYSTGYLIEHWDGVAWTPSTPVATTQETLISQFRGVYALSASDAWAVGSVHSGNIDSTATAHWDGRRWTLVPSPNGTNPAYPTSMLNSITATSPADAWAVGFSADQPFYPAQTLILHWDGQHWTKVPAPSAGAVANELWSVDAASPDDAWAVGFLSNTDFDYDHDRYLYLHWNGHHWKHVRVPGHR
jgi:hypothetical protein